MTAAKHVPKRTFQKVNNETEPKKQTLLLYPKDLKMIDTLIKKYKLSKSELLRKGIEIMYMNANRTVELHTLTGDTSGSDQQHKDEQKVVNCS